MKINIDLNAYAKQKVNQDRHGHFQCIDERRTNVHIIGEYDERLQDLLFEVSARIEYKDSKLCLVFDPPLERRELDPLRWDMALDLECLFWENMLNYDT